MSTRMTSSVAGLKLALIAFSFLIGFGLTATSRADNWPQRPVRVLVGFAPGGSIDSVARVTCARLSQTFGQQFVVENRVGAMGSLAADAVARSSPDGYTLFWAGTGTISIFPAMGNAPFNVESDFDPVAMIGTSTQALVVTTTFPGRSLQDFVQHVKEKPGLLSYAGGGGPGSVSNLLMALFLKRAGLEMIPVSYRGTAPALTDLIAGHIPAMFAPLPEALPQAKAGKIRILAVASEQRSRHAPEVPTVAESGFPGFNGISWHGMLAPKGTSPDIIDAISMEFARAVNDPEFVKQLDNYGADPLNLGPKEFGSFIQKDAADWALVVRSAGVKLN